MNNELYPSSFKNQSAYRNSMPPCDWSTFSTFKPPPLIQSNHQSTNGQLPASTIEQLKQRRQLVPNQQGLKSNANTLNKINLRSKSPPPKVPQRNSSQLASKHLSVAVDQPADASPLWRSKSFASGLQANQQQYQQDLFNNEFNVQSKAKISLRQPPITYANPSASNRNTIHLGKQLDEKVYGQNNLNNNNLNNNNNNLSPCEQSCCQVDSQDAVNSKSHHINKVNDEISRRYLAAAENNFNAMNGLNKMRHSQSHHSYLSAKQASPVQQTNTFNTGTLPNSVSFHGQPLKPINNNVKPGSLDASSLSSIGSSNSGSLSRSSALLAQRYSSVGNLSQTRRFFSALSLGTKSRNPQPQRSLIIFTSIEKGLRECICLTQEDISQLKNAIGNGLQLSSAQQYKNAERFLKRLNFQLAKIEELRDQYEMHMKLSEGVRSMQHLYAFSPGKEKEIALSSVRNELKEYIQTMSLVESELEQSMGSFLLQMQGIQGFARLCAGDVFEITIKCGDKQKWKCKGKILKDNVQSWNSTEQIFRPNLDDQLSIKAVELRGLGKKLCLGSKNCEIKDLFSARPQLMSICLNTTGTLKLHLIVTWNPLHEPKTTINGALSSSLQNSTLNNGTSLTKSKSFTASSTSLLSRFKSANSTNTSSTYSTLNLSNPNHSYGQSFNNSLLMNRTLNNDNKRCTLPSGFEIIDADYYHHHPNLIAENNKRLTVHAGLPTNNNGNNTSNSVNPAVSRVSSMNGMFASNALKQHNRHSYAGFNHTSLSPIHSPNLRVDEDVDQDSNVNDAKKTAAIDTKISKCQQQQQQQQQQLQQQQSTYKQSSLATNNVSNVEGITPTSTGSRGSSLHLTGTTSSGFGSSGSSSSYSSVPNSALASPDNELAPCEKSKTSNRIISDSNNSSPIQCDIYDCGHCGNHQVNQQNNHPINNQTNNQVNQQMNNEVKKQKANIVEKVTIPKNSIVVEATVHHNPESTSNENNKINEQTEQLKNGRTESMDTLTTPDVAYQQQTYFNVGDTLINLMSSLEDIQGQFSELHSLQENVLSLYKVLCQISKLHMIDSNLLNLTQTNRRVRRSSDTSNISNISVSVESALECFDFLNQAGTEDSEIDSVVCTPEHHATNNKQKISKDQIKSNNNDNDSALSTPCVTPSPSLHSTQQLSANCDQIDIALMSHLIYCQRLIENLGAFGPLKSREQSSLAKLQLQAQAVERLVRVCVNLRDYLQFSIELRKDNQLKQNPMDLALELENLYAQFKRQTDIELTDCFGGDQRIAKLWNFVSYLHSTDQEQLTQIELGNNSNNKKNISLGNTLLCCTSAGFAMCLEKFMQINNLVPSSNSTSNASASTLGKLSISMSNLTGLGLSTDANSYSTLNKRLKGNELTTKISEMITKRLIDSFQFEDDYVVSLFQLAIFFHNENSSLEHMFKSYAHEVQLLNSIQSNDAIEIEQALKQFKKTLPPKEPLYSICLLLLDSDQLIVRIAEQYFLNAAKNKSMRQAILNQLLDALQNDNANLRQASCLAITLLNGKEYLSHLVYICTIDSNQDVRNQAKQTLLAVGGNEGKELYIESQRFNHGLGFPINR